MERSRIVAIELFTQLGFEVEEIPEESKKTADLVVRYEGESYLVEAKGKEDIELSEEQFARLEAGKVVSRLDATWANNGIAKVYRRAAKQLEATPIDRGKCTFNLIFLLAEGKDSDLIYSRSLATFYGIAQLIDQNDGSSEREGAQRVVECYYFDHAECLNTKEVDGVFWFDGRFAHLWSNEFSHQREPFIRSILFQRFNAAMAAIDPVSWEKEERIITFRESVRRGMEDEQSNLEILNGKTGRQFMRLRMTRTSAQVIVQEGDQTTPDT